MQDDAYVVTLIDARCLKNTTVSRSSLGITELGVGEQDSDVPVAVIHNDEHGMTLIAQSGLSLFDGGICVESCDVSSVRKTRILTVCGSRGAVAVIAVRPTSQSARLFHKVSFSADTEVRIGRGADNALTYAVPFVSEHHAVLRQQDGLFSIADVGSANGTFVNGIRLEPNAWHALAAGEVVQILDLVFTVGLRFISINAPAEVRFGQSPDWHEAKHSDIVKADSNQSGNDAGRQRMPMFYPAPRLMHSVHVKTFHVDAPPQKHDQGDRSALMQLGPSFLMGIASVFMAFSAVSKLFHGTDIMNALPQIMMAVAMIGGMVVWPLISNRYTKKKAKLDERRRRDKYTDYLNSITARMLEERDKQAAILQENLVPLAEVLRRADELSPQLMDRNAMHDDFLQLRIGIGDQRVQAKVETPKRGFSMDSDALLENAENLAGKPTMMRVPVAVNLAETTSLGIVGDQHAVSDFTRGLLAQVCGLYSYAEVKVVVLSQAAEAKEWEFTRHIPHARSDDGQVRYLAQGEVGLLAVDRMLNDALDERLGSHGDGANRNTPFYVVLCTDKVLSVSSQAVRRLLRLPQNEGFCVLCTGNELKDLPRECSQVIELGQPSEAQSARADYALGTPMVLAGESRIFDRNDVGGSERRFMPDILFSAKRASNFAISLSRARLETEADQGSMPQSLGFMEMFKAGNVLQLNIADRWREHDASRSLATPLGVDGRGQQIVLDLHENAHGPHGLIAGTTGSGKSELIISWILSLAVNYSPDEVEFVLIDYKGGGLAGAFENSRYHLPQLAGTITNLDGTAISRSLVSIQSELKRRQTEFNKARDLTGEATMDINKYISYYRQGVLKKPIPHVFVVADEFAELKQQEPAFMDELVSAARIGRSLGLHLVLATQKPSGVVNDQITSNARFKISLKVADTADSREMLKRPDAAELTRPGEFYLLVGYDELFVGGQSAYTGSDYVEHDAFAPKHDESVELIDLTGSTVARLHADVHDRPSGKSELNAVLGQLMEVGEATGKKASPLWLEPLPSRLLLADVKQRFGFRPSKEGLSTVVGMLDDPERQRQDIFTVDVAKEGNVAIYGAADSGTEALLASMLCSLMQDYTPDELNVYALDMGSGSLSALKDAPHFGGVALLDESERVNSLFLLLEGEVSRRRSLFTSSGGGYDAYIASAQGERCRVPRIVVALSDVASFNETYGRYADRLVALARDAPRYGMHLIMTASAWNQPGMRLRAAIGRSLVTSFSDANEYQNVLSGTRGIVPPKGYLAGLFQNGKEVLRFQGASLAQDVAGEAHAVRDCCSALARSWQGDCAKPIPSLPKHVSVDVFRGVAASPLSVPVGLSKAGASPAFFDASRDAMIVSSDNSDALYSWFNALRLALHGQESSFVLLDSNGMFEGVEDANLLNHQDDIATWIAGMMEGALHADVVVAPSFMQMMGDLQGEVGTAFKKYVETQSYKGKFALVAGSEAWRMRSGFDPWYKAFTANPNGLWIGNGFTDQSVFPHYNIPEILKRAMLPIDGILHTNAGNERVQLFEPSKVKPTTNRKD